MSSDELGTSGALGQEIKTQSKEPLSWVRSSDRCRRVSGQLGRVRAHGQLPSLALGFHLLSQRRPQPQAPGVPWDPLTRKGGLHDVTLTGRASQLPPDFPWVSSPP